MLNARRCTFNFHDRRLNLLDTATQFDSTVCFENFHQHARPVMILSKNQIWHFIPVRLPPIRSEGEKVRSRVPKILHDTMRVERLAVRHLFQLFAQADWE